MVKRKKSVTLGKPNRGLRRAFTELAEASGYNPRETNEAPRSKDAQGGRSAIGGGRNQDFGIHSAPQDELTQYWRLYETFAPIHRLIDEFAAQVVEPGWWLEAESDETAENLAKWLRSACIISGQPDQDFSILLRKAVVQRFVKGTTIVEHVPEGNEQGEISNIESISGLKLLKPETITTFTRKGQAFLLQPEDEMPEEIANDLIDVSDAPDGTPAYIQFYDSRGQTPVPFLASQITKSVRGDDVGDIYGTSGLESVFDRTEAFNKKLTDRERAIETKAWPVWIFQFGSEDNPWFEEEIDQFMDSESGDQFTPGTKHGVQGDISVKTVNTDVPDIESAIKDDLDYILSALPLPSYLTAYVDGDVSKEVAVAKQRQGQRRVTEERRQLEYDFLPMLLAKCENEGWDTESLKLHISPVMGENPQEIMDRRGTNINYLGKGENPDGSNPNGPTGEGKGNQNPSGSGNNDANNNNGEESGGE